jgi:ribosome-binding factor A
MTLKQERMAERIRIILSELLLREVRDPRLEGITVTEVKIDAEIMYADIYVSALGDESREDDVLAGLESAKGFLRRAIGQRIRTRNTPDLHFYWDVALERGERINQLLDGLTIPPPSQQDDMDDWDNEDWDDFDDDD